MCVCVCCIQRLQFLKHLLSYGEASLPPPSPPAGPQTLSSDALRQWRSNLHQPIKKTSQIMPQSAGDVTAFSHVNPSDRKKNPSSAPTDVICFTQLLFQSVKYWRNLQRRACFMGCPVPGLPTGTKARTAFNGGGGG